MTSAAMSMYRGVLVAFAGAKAAVQMQHVKPDAYPAQGVWGVWRITSACAREFACVCNMLKAWEE